MFSIPTIFATLGLLTSSAQAIGCFTSGESYSSVGNSGEITSALTTACASLSTDYTGYQQMSVCSDMTGTGNQIIWTVLNNSNLNATLDKGECTDIFQREVNACSRGSIQDYVNWQITDDPNQGACGS